MANKFGNRKIYSGEATTRYIFTIQLGLEFDEIKFLKIVKKLSDKLDKLSNLYQFQLEQGEKDKRFHLQGFVMLIDKLRGSAFVNKVDTRGMYVIGYLDKLLSQKSFDYTSKDETAIQPNKFRVTRGIKEDLDKWFIEKGINKGKKEGKFKFFADLIDEGASIEQIKRVDNGFCFQNKSKIQQAIVDSRYEEKMKQFPLNFNHFRRVFYIYGASGLGKNRLVNEVSFELKKTMAVLSDYRKDLFFRYNNDEIIVFDEFRSQLELSEFLIYTDKYINVDLPARYYNRKAVYDYVFILSPFSPESQYVNRFTYDDRQEQLLRRIDYTYLLKRDDEGDSNYDDVKKDVLDIICENEKDKEQYFMLLDEEKKSFKKPIKEIELIVKKKL